MKPWYVQNFPTNHFMIATATIKWQMVYFQWLISFTNHLMNVHHHSSHLPNSIQFDSFSRGVCHLPQAAQLLLSILQAAVLHSTRGLLIRTYIQLLSKPHPSFHFYPHPSTSSLAIFPFPPFSLAMAAKPLWKVIFSLVLLSILCTRRARSQVEGMGSQPMSDALEWPSTPSIYDLDDVGDEDMDVEDGGMNRRSLYWRRHYFISYGALSANRIPCPPRSGRSYYTHNCYKRRGPAHPYVRGCSAITRCRRDVY